MPKKVKNPAGRRTGRGARTKRRHTRISSKHQVTIPAVAFRDAGFRPGDTVEAKARGAGQVLLTRVDETLDGYSGRLSTGGKLRRAIDGLRDEWA